MNEDGIRKDTDDLKDFWDRLKQLTPIQKEQIKGIMIGFLLSKKE